ncbi:cuticle protein CP1499-like [Homarus americanus]|uniref:cuticle protein CP1499-like n=1 Tax=Homarus americanus TaxID=6706 RepID=UPI001C4833FD|nr:cuticle protein CP1499-like [Homarus americanus]
MKALVVLAVMGVCSASTYQAYDHGHHYGVPVQPRWTGPVAATVPAGVDGNIIQVPDTYEVAAAKNAFFRAYQNQVDTIRSRRYGTPGYASVPPVAYAPVVNTFTPVVPSQSYGVPSVPTVPGVPATTYGYNVAPGPVQDTPEVAAAKAQFFRTFERQAAAAAAAPDHYTRY